MRNYFYLFFIIAVTAIILVLNYEPNTFLSGWDTLHPEFNFKLNIERLVFGVFRKEQGLGAVAAHSHMADLPRVIFLYLSGYLFPTDFLRYLYIFLNLLLGPIGMYFFLQKVAIKNKTASFLGALFYLLNPGAMQQFYVPFEMFTTQYAALPWLFLIVSLYLNGKKVLDKKKLLFLCFVAILSTPMAYAATLWYLFFISLLLYIIAYSFPQIIPTNTSIKGFVAFCHSGLSAVKSRQSNCLTRIYKKLGFWMRFAYQNDNDGEITLLKKITLAKNNLSALAIKFKKSFVVIFLILAVNSFWILPNIYFIATHGLEVKQANINKLFSEQAFLYNKEFGNIKDISQLKTFYFDWRIYAGNDVFTNLLSPWIKHLKNPIVEAASLIFAIVAFAGVIYSILRLRSSNFNLPISNLRALLPILLLCLFFLFNDNPPTGFLYTFLQKNIPLFGEAFRFPGDKVLGLFTFVYAVYFAAGQLLIIKFLQSLPSKLNSFTDTQNTRRRNIASETNLAGDSERGALRGGPALVSAVGNAWGCEEAGPAGMSFPRSKKPFTPGQIKRFSATATVLQTVIFTSLLVYFMLPAFQGQFISPYMRVQIPKEYFSMFEWFNKSDDGKVANLPIHSFWGWDYYDWSSKHLPGEQKHLEGEFQPSFQGAGFLWFGIKQPVLHRDFDRWNPKYNEQYYREMSYAVYAQNPKLLSSVIKKYKIRYILLDTSVISPENSPTSLFYPEIKNLLKTLEEENFLKKKINFGENLFVYEVNDSPLSLRETESSEAISEKDRFVSFDHAQDPRDDNRSGFLNITDNQNRILPENIKFEQDSVELKLTKTGTVLNLNSYLETENLLPVNLVLTKSGREISLVFYPNFSIQNKSGVLPPMAATIPLPTANLVVSINQKDNFPLKNIPDNTPIFLASIFLNTKKPNTIALYSAEAENAAFTPDFPNLKFSLDSCGELTGNELFGIDFKETSSGFSLFGENSPVCMLVPFKEIFKNKPGLDQDKPGLNSPESMIRSQFIYSGKALSNICVSDLNGSCISYFFSGFTGIQNADIDNLGIKIFLDASHSNTREKISYDNFSLNILKPFFFTSFSTDILKPETENKNVSTDNIVLPFLGNKEVNSDLTALPKTSGKCSNVFFTSVTKGEKQIIQKEADYLRYSSQEGTLCDHFSYQNLPPSTAYLIAVESRNIEGLPLSVCVSNRLSQRCDIYTSLSQNSELRIKNSEFIKDVFLLPPLPRSAEQSDQGFDINIQNLGIKNSPAVNDLKSIQIIPFPYSWISSSRPTTKDQRLKTKDLLTLPYSFEDGWKAFRIQNSEFRIQNLLNTYLPFLFGKELKEHVLVNNWENGWKLDNYTLDANRYTLVIIFWPQYLEYLGFILILLTIGIIVLKRESRRA